MLPIPSSRLCITSSIMYPLSTIPLATLYLQKDDYFFPTLLFSLPSFVAEVTPCYQTFYVISLLILLCYGVHNQHPVITKKYLSCMLLVGITRGIYSFTIATDVTQDIILIMNKTVMICACAISSDVSGLKSGGYNQCWFGSTESLSSGLQ